MAAPQQALSYNDVFDDDDDYEPKEAPTVHHIRANSSIMQVKKILVANRGEIRESLREEEIKPAGDRLPC
jgi:pyruvate carboxylase